MTPADVPLTARRLRERVDPYAPGIAVAVVVDNGGAGSRVAAPIARATLDAWLRQEP